MFSEKIWPCICQKLVDFGTRHTLSDTISKTRGIGAARRWIKNSFDLISEDCNNCLDVFFQKNYFEKNNLRLIKNVWINNVVAIQKGSKYPNRFWRYERTSSFFPGDIETFIPEAGATVRRTRRSDNRT